MDLKSIMLSEKKKTPNPRGAWVAQAVKCLNPDFGSGHDLRVSRLSLAEGFSLGMEPA